MIDTDKYKGHTPAPWKWIIDDKDTYLSCFDNDIKADENLIADAPLLLEEVKRLREGIKKQIEFTLECIGSDIGDLYETIADDLRRLIE